MIFLNKNISLKYSRSLAFTLLLSIAGCSSAPLLDPKATPEPTPIPKQAETTTIYLPEEPTRKKEKSLLNEDILYKLLVAEIAGQRGELDTSIENYLALTKQVKDPVLAERATRVMIYARKDKDALEAAKLWVQYAPSNMEAQQVLAAMYIRKNLPEEAYQQLDQFLTRHPAKTGQAMQLLANFLNRPEDKGTAFRVMERLMSNRQNDAEAMFAYGLLTLRTGDLEKSKDIIKQVTELKPDEQNYHLVYLSILEKEGDKQGALKYLENLLEKHPKDFEYGMAHARMLADLGRYDEARKEFKTLSRSNPDNTDAVYALGLLNLQTNQGKAARAQFEQLIEKQVLVNESSYYLGQISEFEKKYEEAIQWYEAIDSSNSNYFDANIKLALTQARLGDSAKALATLNKLQPQNQNQAIQRVRVKAEILIEENKLEEAKSVYDMAIGEGQDPDLLYSRAMLAEKMNRIDLLERDLKMIIKNDPENANVLNALGYTLADRTDRFEEALGYIEKALALSPNNFYILDSMGWVLYRLGRFEESVEYLKRAKALNNDPEVSAHLSEVLWIKGDKQEARDILNSALKVTPEDEKLLKTLKLLKP